MQILSAKDANYLVALKGFRIGIDNNWAVDPHDKANITARIDRSIELIERGDIWRANLRKAIKGRM